MSGIKLLLLTIILIINACKKQEAAVVYSSPAAIVTPANTPESPTGTYTYLALGDSYTIGQGISPGGSFPQQLVDSLSKKGFKSSLTRVIARTGWTTADLKNSINEDNPDRTFDVVTLLIGVNNQFRGLSEKAYREEFSELLEIAIRFAGGDKTKVLVLSIPDWGATPYARGFTGNTAMISQEINLFNSINKQEADLRAVSYIDITAISRLATNDLSLLASDSLHPSEKMYSRWVELLIPKVAARLR